ncbi:hypothetical protein CCACVL1_27373 [Corchorus capsularis]|uniref:Hydrophobic seed protein domain-containing protein n=1 Tax=Corchorus capsularis TaxID=210143 RepID=A0A1R3GAQ4_COCAP|nr:hypothetical protein CCACVL1_27373 [Corchorus capsularis]
MASSSKTSAPIAFLIALNILFFTLVSSQTLSPPPPPRSPPPPPPSPPPPPRSPPPPPPSPSPPPPPSPSPPPPPSFCPAGLLSGALCLPNLIIPAILNITLGPPNSQCCRNIAGLVGINNLNLCLCDVIAGVVRIVPPLLGGIIGIGAQVNLTVAVGNVLSACNITNTAVRVCVIRI